jgi:hypothetical protein
MLVFHTATGAVTGTFSGDPALLASGSSAFVETALTIEDLGSLADWQVQEGILVRASLAALTDDALAEINRRIADIRCVYITDLPGQGMIYLDKEAEAKAFLAADPEPTDLTEYPWIQREIGVTGTTAYEVAQVLINMAASWRQIGPEIEGLRLEAKDAILAATTASEIDSALVALKTGLAAYA